MFNYNQKINHCQKVLTKVQYEELVRNFRERQKDASPVVKFFYRSCTWLLVDLDPETGIAFGLCDLGQGFPELGNVSLYELMKVGWVERDLHFKAKGKGLQFFVDQSNQAGRITA